MFPWRQLIPNMLAHARYIDFAPVGLHLPSETFQDLDEGAANPLPAVHAQDDHRALRLVGFGQQIFNGTRAGEEEGAQA